MSKCGGKECRRCQPLSLISLVMRGSRGGRGPSCLTTQNIITSMPIILSGNGPRSFHVSHEISEISGQSSVKDDVRFLRKSTQFYHPAMNL